MEPFDREAWTEATRQGMAVAYHARRTPDRLAVVAPTGDLTYAELNAAANRLVRVLRARGLEAGDPVAILCSNRAEFVVTFVACNRGGFRITCVNWHLTPDEAAYIVNDCGARCFVAEGVAIECDAPVKLSVGGELDGFERWEDVLASEPDGSDIDDPTLGTAMLYTSGTTGYPKGVRKPPDPDAQVAGIVAYDYKDGDVHLCTGPLYHAAPFQIAMNVPINAGATVVLMPRWEPEETLRLIAEHRVTHLHLVPTMFHRLLGLPDDVKAAADTSSLRLAIHGAAPCPVPVKQGIIDWWGPVVVEYYAATEGGGTLVDSATWLKKPGTVGFANPAAVYVGDEQGERLPAEEEGLVWMRATGKARFEYFGDEAKTGKTYRGDFFTLGDVGRIDPDGFLFLTDRSANLIISGGVNIYPAEVDAVLLEHPAVGDAAVIGVPDDEWGERVHAVVELKPGATATPEELLDFCKARLSSFKCPRGVDFVDKLPRDENGKLYKRRLRDEYRARAAGSPA